MREIKLPPLGENIESGTVVSIAVKEGDDIKEGSTLLEVESEKTSLEIPSPVSGKVKEVLVKEGQEIKVGDVIMRVEEGATQEKPQEKAEEPKKPESAGKKEKPQQKENEPAKPEPAEEKGPASGASRESESEKKETPAGEVPAAPSVRRMAREMDVDLTQVSGSGSHGRITEEDIKDYICSDSQEKLPDFAAWGEVERKPMSPFRIKTMDHLSFASRNVAPVTQFNKADITKLEELLKDHSTEKRKLTITSYLIKTVAGALKAFPQFNVSADAEKKELIYKKYYHISVAVDTGHGLMAPVIRDAEKKNIFELADELRDIAERARHKNIKPEELQGGCFTITNLGKAGGTGFTPIVNWPEVAILGVSEIHWEPVFRGDAFVPGRIVNLSLSYDHRFVDGVEGANFLHWIVGACEDPFLLELEG